MHMEERKHTKHDLDMSPSTKQSNAVSGKFSLTTLANTVFEKLKKFLVQWTDSHFQGRRQLSTRLVQ